MNKRICSVTREWTSEHVVPSLVCIQAPKRKFRVHNFKLQVLHFTLPATICLKHNIANPFSAVTMLDPAPLKIQELKSRESSQSETATMAHTGTCKSMVLDLFTSIRAWRTLCTG